MLPLTTIVSVLAVVAVAQAVAPSMIRPTFGATVPTAIEAVSFAALIETVAVEPAKAQVAAPRATDGAAISATRRTGTAATALPRADAFNALTGNCIG